MSTLTRDTAPDATLRRIAADLLGGSIAIFPTETVYGLGTSAFSQAGLSRIYRIKDRARTKPLALLVGALEDAAPLIDRIPPEALRLSARFCPGPLTLVFQTSPLGRLTMGGRSTVAVRIPDHPFVRRLLGWMKVPLAATSVNRSGQAPLTSGQAAARRFGQKVDWVVDGGDCRMKRPSSVVDLTAFPFTVVREGALSKKQLEEALHST